MRLLPRAALLAAILCIPIACAGPSNQSGGFAPAPVTHAGAKQRVTLKIKIPKKSKASRKHRGRYISPATTQMTIDVQTGCPANCASVTPYPTTAPLTSNSSGCTSTLASTLCQLTLTLPPGDYTVALTTADASGTALSLAQSVPLDVVAGHANTLSVALSGIPYSIATTSIGQNAFIATALDADGNVIVGAGAPAFTIASTGGISVAIVQPTATSPNLFRVTPRAAGSASLSITAAYAGGTTDGCAQTGAQCIGSVALTSTPTGSSMFVGDNRDSAVNQYNAPFGAAPVATLNGSGDVTGLAVNSSGDLFVSSAFQSPSVLEYAPPYTGAPILTITTGLTNPYGIAFDSHDNLFVADYGANVVLEYTPPYNGAPTTVASAGISVPEGIALDSSDNLYVVDFPSKMTKYAAPSYGSVAATLTGLNFPEGVAVDSSGNVLFTNYQGTRIDETDSSLSSDTSIIFGLSTAGSMAFDLSGNLYVTNQNNGVVSEYDSSHSIVNANLITGLNSPLAIAIYNDYAATISP